MKRISVLLALAGIGVVVLLLAWFNAGSVWSATISVGWAGFLLLVAWQAGLFVVLGLAWAVVLPGVTPVLLIWGRMVRDAATTCLPFSPVGGYVIGARAVTLGFRAGLDWPVAAAGTVVDVTAEILAQMVFSLFGAAIALLLLPEFSFAAPVAAGIAVALALLLLVVWQRARIGRAALGLGTRLAGEAFRAQGGLDRLRTELARLYRLDRLAMGAALHLCGWFMTGIGTWIALHLLGAQVDMLHVLALEALLDALVAAAFIVPGAAGVQEAGYVGIGALFGVPADLALSVSLLRRAKDLVWGLPILAVWQMQEVRHLRAARQPGSL